jgi:hypothetical protein
VTCPDDEADWPPDGALFDNANADHPLLGDTRFMYRKGRHRPIHHCRPIDDYHPTPEGPPQ